MEINQHNIVILILLGVALLVLLGLTGQYLLADLLGRLSLLHRLQFYVEDRLGQLWYWFLTTRAVNQTLNPYATRQVPRAARTSYRLPPARRSATPFFEQPSFEDARFFLLREIEIATGAPIVEQPDGSILIPRRHMRVVRAYVEGATAYEGTMEQVFAQHGLNVKHN